jgi:hypothetical protein
MLQHGETGGGRKGYVTSHQYVRQRDGAIGFVQYISD